MNRASYHVADLFCGAGGTSSGLMQAAPTLKPARKLTSDEIVSLLRSTYYRYWKLRRASREDV